MSKDQTFLIKYGIHNYVKCVEEGSQVSFLIKKTQRETMINHARMLIETAYGKSANILIE